MIVSVGCTEFLDSHTEERMFRSAAHPSERAPGNHIYCRELGHLDDIGNVLRCTATMGMYPKPEDVSRSGVNTAVGWAPVIGGSERSSSIRAVMAGARKHVTGLFEK